MRLWTLQNETSIEAFTHGEWFSDGSGMPVKMIDEEYVEYDKRLNGVWIDAVPLICFARVNSSDAGLSLYSFCMNLNWLLRSNICGDRGILWELEVPESAIVSMRPYDMVYQEYVNMPPNTPRGERYKYIQLKNTEWIVHENYKNHLRHKFKNKSVEALILSLRKEHIVCYRKFEYIDHCYKITTEVVRPEAFPTFTEDVFCGTDGYLRTDDDAHESLSMVDASRIIAAKGMSGCPRYYSIAEALGAANEKTWKVLNAKLVEKNIPKSRFDYVTVNDLFPDGLRIQ